MQAGAIVYGIPVQDANQGNLVKTVMHISVAMAIMSVAVVVVSVVVGDYFNIINLACLGIPICGYLGARNRSRQLLTSFIWMNMTCVIVFCISAILTVAIYIPLLRCVCDPECADTHLSDDQIPDDPDELCENEESRVTAYIATICLGLCVAVLQCMGYVFGRKLSASTLFVVGAGPALEGINEADIPVAQPIGRIAGTVMTSVPAQPADHRAAVVMRHQQDPHTGAAPGMTHSPRVVAVNQQPGASYR